MGNENDFFLVQQQFENNFLSTHNIQSQKNQNQNEQKKIIITRGNHSLPIRLYLSSLVTLLTDDGWTSPRLRQLFRFEFLGVPSQC